MKNKMERNEIIYDRTNENEISAMQVN